MKKKIILTIAIVTVLAGVSYGAYRAYHLIIEDAITRIRTGVKKGLGIGRILNPFAWFR